ncbi:hypothetical protein E2C01_025544 [Portunus trituberculatus]|uniref:Uncharacterized protein n=1 Tax=Portunus trituberculatus TaxID=210409 RepID=A0A5B7EG75_PORTR|nr:hypothetical protein [Portunus trituberculatus]
MVLCSYSTSSGLVCGLLREGGVWIAAGVQEGAGGGRNLLMRLRHKWSRALTKQVRNVKGRCDKERRPRHATPATRQHLCTFTANEGHDPFLLSSFVSFTFHWQGGNISGLMSVET